MKYQTFFLVVPFLAFTTGIHVNIETAPHEHSPPGAKLAKHGIVLRRGMEGSWDAGMVESPAIWFDHEQKRYGMVYTGYAHVKPLERGYGAVARPQVGLAWSDDLFTWEKEEQSPIFGPSGTSGSYDSDGTSGPFIWYENGKYHLYYFGTTARGYEKGTKTLNLATSRDLRTWTRYEKNPIIRPEGKAWRKDAIWHPNIVKVKETYYLFFNASGIANTMHEEFIGYATSKDLYTWTVDDEHSPLIVGSGKAGRWDATGRTGDPSLYRVGTIWYMAYYSWDRKNSQDGLAWTTEEAFPLGWKTFEHNPVLRIGPPGSYDALHAGKPFIVHTNERHFHFYTAVDEKENREIALAVWPPP